MKINKKKSKIMFIDPQKNFTWEKNIKKKVKGYDLCLRYVSLGIIIQRNLNLEEHTQKIINKVERNLKMIFMLKAYNTNPEYIILTWYAMIQSHFRYGTFLYNEKLDLHMDNKQNE